MEALGILQKYFGYEEFRGSQEEIVKQILSGRDVLAIMPTGAGKSICYQIPALILSGMTLVISPLISLMKDQVQALKENGIPAEVLNSSLSREEYFATIDKIRRGQVKLLYISPERLDVEGFVEGIGKQEISFVAVDEAHCISQWGHDFRPSYRRIHSLIEEISPRPIIGAFTATATTGVKEDILSQLELDNPHIEITGFDRPNLFPMVEREVDKDSYLLQNLEKEESAIIYCATRKIVDKVYDFLETHGFPVGKYHGGMTKEQRDKMQNLFIYDKKPIMVASLAFGMGIDKPDVRKVIHYNLPKSMENYYQEVGRGGRDGEPFKGILLYSPGDIIIQRFLLDHNDCGEEDYEKLDAMVSYAQTNSCQRKYILNYFNEEAPDHCGNCQNCKTEFIYSDISLEAQKILSCVYRVGERFGGGMVADVLIGSRNKKVLTQDFDKLSTYGIVKDKTKKEIQEIIEELVFQGFLNRSNDRYRILSLNEKSRQALKNKIQITIRRRKEDPVVKAKVMSQAIPLEKDQDLFEELRHWRKEKAREEKLPPYIIANDATLRSLIQVRPRNFEELLNVQGIGERKRDQIGEELLEILLDYEKRNPVQEKKEGKEPSFLISYQLYQRGMGLGEMASYRNLKETTVVSHLLEASGKGYAIKVEDLVSQDHIRIIREKIQELKTGRLKPYKEALPEEITYDEIRFVLNDEKIKGNLEIH